jgi:hypothetical protein
MATFTEDLHPRDKSGMWMTKGEIAAAGNAIIKKGAWNLDAKDKKEIAKYKDFLSTGHVPIEISDDEKRKLGFYVGAVQSYSINASLRKGDLHKDWEPTVAVLDALIARDALTDDTILYRAYSKDFIKTLDEMEPGDSFVDDGFSSTSYEPVQAENQIKILAPKGSKAFVVPPDMSGNENEIIVARGSKFEFVGDDESGIKVFRLLQDGVGTDASKPSDEGLSQHLTMVAKLQTDNHQHSNADFVLKNGQQYKVTKDSFKGKRDKAKLCYMNAGKIAMENSARTYVEGFISFMGIPVQHAWTVDDKGNVFDTTLKGGEDIKNVKGYFGVPFEQSYVSKTALKTKVWGIISRTNPDLWNAKSMVGIVKGAKEPPTSETPAQDLLLKNHDDTATLEDVTSKISFTEQAKMDKADAEMKELKPTMVEFTDDKGVYTPERQALHAEILNRMFTDEKIKAAMPKAGKRPVLILTGGRPAAGKTSALKKELSSEVNSIYLSADTIQEELPGYRGDHAGIYNGEAQDIALQAEQIARDAGINLTYDATLKSTQPAMDRVDLYKAAGYDVHGYFVHTTPVTSALRSVKRFMETGRYVPPIVSFKSKTNEKTFDTLIPKLDVWALYDNNGRSPVKIAGSSR